MRLCRFVGLVSPCILALTWLASITRVVAGNVTLAWDPDSDPNVVGYRLHSGTTSGVYTQTTEVGNVTAASVSNLVNGNTYFFVVTAYDANAVESAVESSVLYRPDFHANSNSITHVHANSIAHTNSNSYARYRCCGDVEPATGVDLYFVKRDFYLERGQRDRLCAGSGQLTKWRRYL